MKLTPTKLVSVDELISEQKKTVTPRRIDMPSRGTLMGVSPEDPEDGDDKHPQEKELTPEIYERYYLPVLLINTPDEWPSKPMEERRRFTDQVAFDTCLGNCCGVKGLRGACCHLDPDDLEHVLGPVKDKDWIRDTVAWFKRRGINYTRQDIVIDYDEGRIIGDTLFKNARNAAVFKDEKAYPILRFQVVGPRYACKFMNPETHMCDIYEIRPKLCSSYLCSYITSNFLVKTKSHPGSYRRIR